MAYTERFTDNKQSRGGAAIDLIVIHDEEGDSNADNLGAYLQRPSVQASYNVIVDKDGNVCRGVLDSEAPWAAGPIANNAGLHLCFTGRASFTRQQWIDRGPQMDAAAQVVAAWSLKFSIPLNKIGTPELNAPAPGGRGVCGHADVAQAWRETSHTDPGSNFPWDVLISKARNLAESKPQNNVPTDDGGFDMSTADDVKKELVGDPPYSGWPLWRFGSPSNMSLADWNRGLTLVDVLRSLDRETCSWIDGNRPTRDQRPNVDTLLGQATSAHAASEELLVKFNELQATVNTLIQLVTALSGLKK